MEGTTLRTAELTGKKHRGVLFISRIPNGTNPKWNVGCTKCGWTGVVFQNATNRGENTLCVACREKAAEKRAKVAHIREAWLRRRDDMVPQWAEDFERFMKEAGKPRGKKRTLSRPDDQQPFGPSNYEWTTKAEAIGSHASKYEYKGEFLTVREIAKRKGVSRQRVHQMLQVWLPGVILAGDPKTEENLNLNGTIRGVSIPDILAASKARGVTISTVVQWVMQKGAGAIEEKEAASQEREQNKQDIKDLAQLTGYEESTVAVYLRLYGLEAVKKMRNKGVGRPRNDGAPRSQNM